MRLMNVLHEFPRDKLEYFYLLTGGPPRGAGAAPRGQLREVEAALLCCSSPRSGAPILTISSLLSLERIRLHVSIDAHSA